MSGTSPPTATLWQPSSSTRGTSPPPKMRSQTPWRLVGFHFPLTASLRDCINVSNSDKTTTNYTSPVLSPASGLQGVDINCGGYYTSYAESAMEQGKLREEDLDRALINLFSVQIRLGLFDGDPAGGPFSELGPRHVCSEVHQSLALEAARQGIVLLKNDRGFLPLSPEDVATFAVVGPAANSTASSIIGGGYTGSSPSLLRYSLSSPSPSGVRLSVVHQDFPARAEACTRASGTSYPERCLRGDAPTFRALPRTALMKRKVSPARRTRWSWWRAWTRRKRERTSTG